MSKNSGKSTSQKKGHKKEYFDLSKIEKYYDNKIEAIKQDDSLTPRNREIISNYLRDSELGKTIKKGTKRKISAGRNLQVAGILRRASTQWFKKTDLDKVTLQQMEKFILDLDKGRIKSDLGKPYSPETASNIKKLLRKFYKHILGNGTHYPALVEWIDTSKEETKINAVPGLKEGVWKIVELIPDIRRKALVWATFDSGFREGEIINCRIKDLEEGKEGVYYLSCDKSKTKPRTVSLPLSSELVKRWIEEHPDKKNREASLWQTSRAMLDKTVKRYGAKAHNQNITVHMLRHTSATFYAPKLPRVVFCKRFGWSYYSKTPDRYIDFAQIHEQETVKILKTESYEKMKERLATQEAVMITMQEQLEVLSNKIADQEYLNARKKWATVRKSVRK